jgi:mannose-1-phosphate guanylyltransferase
MKKTAVIMAGGSGERFWPLSRKRKPKQLLKLLSDKTMIEESIQRVDGIIAPEDIFIITSEVLVEPIRQCLPQLPPQNVIAEPYKRNTAPCLALAAAFIQAKYQNEFKPEEILIAVLTADQSINPEDGFKKTIVQIFDYVAKNEVLSTIGIVPNRPETGYGYVQVEVGQDLIRPAVKFHEKPSLEKAHEFLADGNYFWNSGMFFWRLDVFNNSMIKFLPEVGNQILPMAELYKGNTEIAFDSSFEATRPIFEKFPDLSIDYGLMEKADNVVTAKALFDWDDIGAWDSLDRIREKDEAGNIQTGNPILIDSKNTTVLNESTNSHIKFAGIGLEDFVVVITDDSVMISPKSRVQEVKKAVEIMKKSGEDKWL